MSVRVVQDRDPTHEGGDFIRVYCQQRAGSPATFATIERVFGGEVRTHTWSFRTLVSEAPMPREMATRLAEAYAERKHIPVVYVEVDQRDGAAVAAAGLPAGPGLLKTM
jgi:phosphoenolpyruvate synthase/pyruvate phosphate dikinase